MKEFKVFSEPPEIHSNMLKDIESAKEFVYLETFEFGNDKIGKQFLDVLIKKAKQGVKIKLLIDAWGSEVKRDFFKDLEKAGGELRFFKELRYVIRIFSANHERNHRKLTIIDENITYLGSMNITSECLNWRELVLRLQGKITLKFKQSFFNHWDFSGKLTKQKLGKIIHKGFELIQDIPAAKFKLTENKYLKLIKNAKKEILIETPYFVPSFRIRRALYNAVKRKVSIIILLPHKSDVGIADIIRNRYLGKLYRKGIKINYYLPRNLHSKLLIVDNKFFILGSSNLDYRSFTHQYELNLFGEDKKIINYLRNFFMQGIKESEKFNYNQWKQRSSLNKIIETMLSYIRKFL